MGPRGFNSQHAYDGGLMEMRCKPYLIGRIRRPRGLSARRWAYGDAMQALSDWAYTKAKGVHSQHAHDGGLV
jgi:hypothetical protein